jgi:hypothetical protein
MAKKLLIVDDNEHVLKLLKISLEKAGYTVAQAANGDSGGPVFARNGEGEWELVGIMFTVGQQAEDPKILAVYGDLTFAIDIHAYRDQIEKIVASSPDHDRDGILDVDDNCTRVVTRSRPTRTATEPATPARSQRVRKTPPRRR